MQGYWAGYLSNETPETLYTGSCPLGFFSYKRTGNFTKLPGKASKAILSELVCGKYRVKMYSVGNVMMDEVRTTIHIFTHVELLPV